MTGTRTGTSHSVPPHPGPHTHVLFAVHLRCVSWQSKSVRHQHVDSVTQGMDAMGFGPVFTEAAHVVSGKGVTPSLPTHRTERDWVPFRRVQESGAPTVALHTPQGPTHQLTILVGQGNRLHARSVVGGACTAHATHPVHKASLPCPKQDRKDVAVVSEGECMRREAHRARGEGL
jgi:hypothetical protein